MRLVKIMEKIRRFIECLIPVTACNLKCSYCYVIQRNKNEGNMPKLEYPPEHIGRALTKERLGGCCYFSLCGAGETLLPRETLLIVKELLHNGHYVNITTNGTLTQRFKDLLGMLNKDELERLHFAFSFHYTELERVKKIDEFFDNINRIKKAGCSFVVQLNLCDEYISHIEEIKKICKENIGAYPQIAATRRERNLSDKVELMTEYSKEEYTEYGQVFESKLFDFTMDNFNVKRKEYCYAGDWSFVLNLQTGKMNRCYGCSVSYNIFENINRPIPFAAIGTKCKSLFCMNSSHFMSLGIIPDIKTPTYAELRNRITDDGEEWYSPRMKAFLSEKLENTNSRKKTLNTILANLRESLFTIIVKVYSFIYKV